jgi:hypothetical protein
MKTLGYTKEWEDEFVINEKSQRCLELWDQFEMGIESESTFIKERDLLYQILLRICEKDMETMPMSHPMVRKVKKIRTSKDQLIKDRIKKGCEFATRKIAEGDLGMAQKALDKVEKLDRYLGRPESLCDVHVEVYQDHQSKNVFVRQELIL